MLSGLHYLDLANAPITDLSPLAKLAELRWLILRGARADVSVLAQLSGCQIITTATMPRRRMAAARQ